MVSLVPHRATSAWCSKSSLHARSIFFLTCSSDPRSSQALRGYPHTLPVAAPVRAPRASLQRRAPLERVSAVSTSSMPRSKKSTAAAAGGSPSPTERRAGRSAHAPRASTSKHVSYRDEDRDENMEDWDDEDDDKVDEEEGDDDDEEPMKCVLTVPSARPASVFLAKLNDVCPMPPNSPRVQQQSAAFARGLRGARAPSQAVPERLVDRFAVTDFRQDAQQEARRPSGQGREAVEGHARNGLARHQRCDPSEAGQDVRSS